MPLLPEHIHERLIGEFTLAAAKVAEAQDLAGKLYYFSVFFGEPGRQLNNYWDADLALLHYTVQVACTTMPLVAQLPPIAAPPIEEFLLAIDKVSNELVAAFERPELDRPRLYAALGRIAELTFATTGNGAYLRQKGMIKL